MRIPSLETFSGRISWLFSESLGLKSPSARVPVSEFVYLGTDEYFTARILRRIRIRGQSPPSAGGLKKTELNHE